MTTATSTITAVATPAGTGGIAVIRLSGPDAFAIADKIWKGTPLSNAESHTAHLGYIIDTNGDTLDQAVATIFRSPKSFTGEDTVEFAVHGSPLIQSEVIKALCDAGATPAAPGEFSSRAFLNGRIDLAQAEGIADLISASSRAAHRLAMTQTRGHFSQQISLLTDKMMEFASLLELELDFSEEEVEFADRSTLRNLCDEILDFTTRLADSYRAGKVFKEGVPVVIAGVPNAGKSTLLNRLIHEEKAIVTDIPGTTRDVIEDTAGIADILFRFCDTAGLRTTADKVESIGIEKALSKIREAFIILFIIDATQNINAQIDELNKSIPSDTDATVIAVVNKIDLLNQPDDVKDIIKKLDGHSPVTISASTGEGIETLEHTLMEKASRGFNPAQDLIVTNARHYEALTQANAALLRARQALNESSTKECNESFYASPLPISADFIAQDVREAIHHLSLITGTITTDTLLHSIFSRFCIGK